MKIVLLIALTILSTAALADESSTYAQATPYSKVYEKGDYDAHREDKDFTLTVAPIGFTGGATLGVSNTFSAGYFLNKRNILFIEGSHESGSGTNATWFLFDPTSSMTYDTDMSVWGVGLRHFVNKWLYLKTTADYIVARANATYSPGWFDSSSTSHGSVQGNAIAAAVGIGNEWQWSTFNLGIQWIGALVPLTSNVTVDNMGPGGPSTARDDQNSLKNSLFTSVEYEFARVYVGVAF